MRPVRPRASNARRRSRTSRTVPPWPDEPVRRDDGTMQPLGVHHVAITVDDVEAAMHFYVDVLGLGVRTDRPGLAGAGAWLDVGGQQVHLVQAEGSRIGPHFAIEVDDIDRAIADLRAHDIDVSDAVPIGTARQAFLTDPAGNQLELNQPAATNR
jgi:glyoxylase I family protein